MRHTHYIYIATALALLTGCANDDITNTYTVGADNNVIALTAGMAEGGSSRAYSRATDDNHSSHLTLTQGTKMAMRIDGTWTGHSPETVSQTTTGTVGAETEKDSKHNTVSTDPVRYWDDYGTADPKNSSTGRTTGLTIYAATIDNVETAPTVSSWTEQEWNVGSVTDNQVSQTAGWSSKDLLVSNNIKGDNTYKFTEQTASSQKLLEFTHAMTKVTVNLTAGAGFAEKKFVSEPKVTLLGFNYTGKVNVETKTSTPTASTTTNIVACINDGATWASATTAQATALVFPGNTFADATDIVKVEADGNIYYVNAKAINTANTEANNTFEQGREYILNITVNKTDIQVTATVKDWVPVKADTVEPEIKVTSSVGDTSGNKEEGFTTFDFYLSITGEASGYGSTKDATASGTKTDGTAAWTFSPNLYWPSHNTHYFMRGVYPTSTTVTNGIISVANGDYNATTSPSNLLVGAPVIAANTMCGSTDHTSVDMSTNGICAREANINLTFNYMMSQVEVHLTTSGGNDKVALANAKVEIVNGYTAGNVDIHTKTVSVTGNTGDFEVKHIESEDANYRHSIIVPQSLTNGEGENIQNLKFKITITNSDNTTDIYYATIKDIKVTEDGTKKSITAWESGKHYIYTLDMRKTEVKVSATLADWKTVDASQEIWF